MNDTDIQVKSVENRMIPRRYYLLITVISILFLISLAEGIILLNHFYIRDKTRAAVPPAVLNPVQKDDEILHPTAEDIDRIHNQISRLFHEMNRETAFGFQHPLLRSSARQPRQGSKPSDNIQRLQSEIESIFQKAFDSRHESVLNLLEQDWHNVRATSALNMEESETNYLVTVSMPDFQKDEISINLRGRLLTIVAGKEQHEMTDNSRAATAGRFQTQIMLPAEAKNEAAEASFANGVLTVTVPKSPASNSLARNILIR
jgi:HSP20 family protein